MALVIKSDSSSCEKKLQAKEYNIDCSDLQLVTSNFLSSESTNLIIFFERCFSTKEAPERTHNSSESIPS